MDIEINERERLALLRCVNSDLNKCKRENAVVTRFEILFSLKDKLTNQTKANGS